MSAFATLLERWRQTHGEAIVRWEWHPGASSAEDRWLAISDLGDASGERTRIGVGQSGEQAFQDLIDRVEARR